MCAFEVDSSARLRTPSVHVLELVPEFTELPLRICRTVVALSALSRILQQKTGKSGKNYAFHAYFSRNSLPDPSGINPNLYF